MPASLWTGRLARMAAAEADISRPMNVTSAACGTSSAEHVLKLLVRLATAIGTAAQQKGGRHEYDPVAALRSLQAAHTALTGESTPPPVNLAMDADDTVEWLPAELDRL